MAWPWRRTIERSSIVLIQGSLQPNTLTDILFQEVAGMLATTSVELVTVDVRNRNIDFYYPRPRERQSQETRAVLDASARARGFVIVSPVYGTTIPGAVKDMIMCAQDALRGKAAGLLCVGNNDDLYPASRALITFLSDCCGMTVVKPIVRASTESFREGRIFDEQISAVTEELVVSLVKKIQAH